MSEESSDEEMAVTPDFITKTANSVIDNLLPEKSQERYMKAYDEFSQWRHKNKVSTLSENVLLVYFSGLSQKYQASTLWAIYSMLKSTLRTKLDIDISTFNNLKSFLKRTSIGHNPRKSKVFTAEDITKFLNEAPDEIYLATKVALIIGISGACRTKELTEITVQDMETVNDFMVISLKNTKTHTNRSFVVRDEFVKLIKKYHEFRPLKCLTNRFFLTWRKGRCVNQVIGKNKIASMPKEIATFLEIPNAELYTGHSFRRTSATLLAEAGANLTSIQQLGGWKSAKVAEGYIEESLQSKSKITKQVTQAINLKSTSRPGTSKTSKPQCTKETSNISKLPPSEPIPETSKKQSSEEDKHETDNHVELSQNNIVHIPGKPVNLSLNNCSNVTIHFHYASKKYLKV